MPTSPDMGRPGRFGACRGDFPAPLFAPGSGEGDSWPSTSRPCPSSTWLAATWLSRSLPRRQATEATAPRAKAPRLRSVRRLQGAEAFFDQYRSQSRGSPSGFVTCETCKSRASVSPSTAARAGIRNCLVQHNSSTTSSSWRSL